MKKVKIRHKLSPGWTKVFVTSYFRGNFLLTLSGAIGGHRPIISYILTINEIPGKSEDVKLTSLNGTYGNQDINVKWLPRSSTQSGSLEVWIYASGVKTIIPLGTSKSIEILNIPEEPPVNAISLL